MAELLVAAAAVCAAGVNLLAWAEARAVEATVERDKSTSWG